MLTEQSFPLNVTKPEYIEYLFHWGNTCDRVETKEIEVACDGANRCHPKYNTHYAPEKQVYAKVNTQSF